MGTTEKENRTQEEAEQMAALAEEEEIYEDEIAYWMELEKTPQYVMTKMDSIAVGAGIKLGILMRAPCYGVRWIKRGLSILTNDEIFRLEVIKEMKKDVKEALAAFKEKFGGRSGNRSGKMGNSFGDMTEAELEQLVEWKVLRVMEDNETYTEVVQLFKIPKPDNVSRLIMNAQAGNIRSNDSPDFSLARCEEIRKRLTDLGPAFMVSADLRQFFYQIKICKAFQQILAVVKQETKKQPHEQREKAKRYVAQVLPMGHSWSPWLSMTVCWAIMLMNHDSERMTSRKKSPHSPDYEIEIPEDVPDIINLRRKSDGKVVGRIHRRVL